MKVYLISRHKGTIEYFKERIPDIEVIEHLDDINAIEDNSTIYGNLPINLIEKLVNEKNCRFILVTLNVPKELRGQELTKEQLEKYMELYEFVCLRLRKVEI